MSPFSGGERSPAAGREPPLASAAAGRGMVRRKVGKLLFPVLTAMMFVPGLQKLIQQPPWVIWEGLKLPIVYKSWIEIKGHKRLGVDENWVLKISAKSTLGTTAVRRLLKS